MYKWIMLGMLSIVGVFACFLLLFNLPEKMEISDEETAFVVPEREINVTASEKIYESRCISCHATDLQGGIGPALTQIGSSKSKEEIYKLIANGRGVMPAFKDELSEDEIITITTWLASFQ